MGSNHRINQLFIDLTRAILMNKQSFLTKKFKNIEQILNVLVDHHLIIGYETFNKKYYKVDLVQGPSSQHFLKTIEYHSSPGRKRFFSFKDILKYKNRNQLNILGFLRTKSGFLTIQACYKLKIGGELLVTLK